MPKRNSKGEIELSENDLERREAAVNDRSRWRKFAPDSADTPQQEESAMNCDDSLIF